jgi:hypothetical protein
MFENPYTATARQLEKFNSLLPEGGEMPAPTARLAHYPVRETGLAACLFTLGIPFREPGVYTDVVTLDDGHHERGRGKHWWLSDKSNDQAHDTAQLLGAWANRLRFEAEFPEHPFLPMRAGLDARDQCLYAIASYRAGQARLPIEYRGSAPTHITESLHGTSLLLAFGHQPLAYTGRAFILTAYPSARAGSSAPVALLHAEERLKLSALYSQTPEGWLAAALYNNGQLLKFIKGSPTIIRTPFDNQTLLLTADASGKLREKFMRFL